MSSPKISVKMDGNGNPVGFAEGTLELEADPDEKPVVKFTFPEDSVFANEEVVAVLWQLEQHVSEIVDQFAN